MKTSFFIEPNKVKRILLIFILFLFIGQCLYLFSTFIYGYSYRFLFSFFDFNSESNLPTLFSVIILSFAAVLLISVGLLKKKKFDKDANYWLILGGIFVILSYDEAAQMHEKTNEIVRTYIDLNDLNFLYFSWVIPYSIILLFLGIYFYNFLKNLPKKTVKLFILSGALFVFGAVGLELIGAHYYVKYGESSLFFNIEATFEELFEMLGVVIFIYAILDYVKSYFGTELNISFNNKAENVKEITFTPDYDKDIKIKPTNEIIYKKN